MYPGKESQNSPKRYTWQHIAFYWASLVAQMVKNLPALQETQIQSLGQKDPPEKGMATHSSTLAWRIPWTEEPSRLQSMGQKELDMTATKHMLLDESTA